VQGRPRAIEILPRLGDHDPLIERLGQTCCKMLAEGLGDYFADGVSRWLAAQMVAAHSTGLRCAEPKVTGLSAGQLRKVSGFIEENLEDPLNIEDIAAVVGLNPIHFARQFKRSTGKPPYQFVIEKGWSAPANCWPPTICRSLRWRRRRASAIRSISPASSGARPA
jgi:AraC family transcriptional regulator